MKYKTILKYILNIVGLHTVGWYRNTLILVLVTEHYYTTLPVPYQSYSSALDLNPAFALAFLDIVLVSLRLSGLSIS